MKRYSNNSVLLIPDTHAPYHHKDAIEFLGAVKEKYEPDRVIHMGDWTDSYCFTSFPKDIEQPDSYTTEYKKVRRFTEEILGLFPEGIMLRGNHDYRLWQRAKAAGVPRGLIVPYERVIGLEDTEWRTVWDYQLTVDANRRKWYFAHTKTASPLICAKSLGMSVAFGHTHTKFAVETFQHLDHRIYGVSAGCLLGDDRYAFAYNKQSLIRPNLGCVVIVRGIPRLIPMDCGPSGKWNRIVH